MRVLVCGGRDYNNEGYLFNVLHRHVNEGDTIIHGGAKGADAFADHYACIHHLPCFRYPANWGKYDKAAGYIRNKQMLDEGLPDKVVAFSGGRGTAMMVKLAKEAGVEVIKIEDDIVQH